MRINKDELETTVNKLQDEAAALRSANLGLSQKNDELIKANDSLSILLTAAIKELAK